MSHKHHSCECKHKEVKYCSTCRVVHCLDCNMEWAPKSKMSLYPQLYENNVYKNGLNLFKNTYTPSTEQK